MGRGLFMGISYTHIHFPCLNMARVGCNITDSYLDRGASRKGSIALQPYFAIDCMLVCNDNQKYDWREN